MDEDCTVLPSGFELEVQLVVEGARPPLGSLQVIMQADDDRWWRFFDVSTAFDDDLTSFAVEVSPPRTEPTPITLELVLFTGPDGSGRLLARRQQTFELQANACNTYSMELTVFGE